MVVHSCWNQFICLLACLLFVYVFCLSPKGFKISFQKDFRKQRRNRKKKTEKKKRGKPSQHPLLACVPPPSRGPIPHPGPLPNMAQPRAFPPSPTDSPAPSPCSLTGGTRTSAPSSFPVRGPAVLPRGDQSRDFLAKEVKSSPIKLFSTPKLSFRIQVA
jgi:hypothetical protein